MTLLYYLIIDTAAYMALRHYALWDRRRSVMIILALGLVCTYVPVLVLGMISVRIYVCKCASFELPL